MGLRDVGEVGNNLVPECSEEMDVWPPLALGTRKGGNTAQLARHCGVGDLSTSSSLVQVPSSPSVQV